jgi:hypothetical protein
MFEQPSVLERRFGLGALDHIQRRRAALAAAEAQILVGLAGASPREQRVAVHDPVSGSDRTMVIVDAEVDLVAASLHRSPATVRRQVSQARMLHTGLRRTTDALASGRITPEHAEHIVRTANDLPAAMLSRYEAEVLAKASLLTPRETGTLARRVRARLDRAGEEARRAAARRHEDVRVWAEGDGLACLMARLPIADAARVHEALQQRAREVDLPCDATLGQRRARGLVEAVCGTSGETSAVGVQVLVTVDVATLAGLADSSALVALGAGAPEPITAAALRELLRDESVPVTLRRLLTDPVDGRLVDRGREAYRVSNALRAFLVARDGTCRFPGCGRAAVCCDIDHAVPWGEGGATDRSNLGPLCRRHHVLKTHLDWRIVRVAPDGRTTWRGPDGREYVFHPFPVVDPPDPPDPPDPVAVGAPGDPDPPFPF